MPVTITIPDETAMFITDLINKMDRTDRRGTADPFFIQVRHFKEQPVPDGCGEGIKYYSSYQCESYEKDEIEELFKEYCDENPNKYESLDDFIEGEGYRAYEYSYVEVFENFFLSMEGFNEHMKWNGHNYRYYHKTDSYIQHGYRNPELTGIIKSLRQIDKSIKMV